MKHLISVLPLFFTLILCAANVYSMNNYRISLKRPFLVFAVMTLLCFGGNAYIIIAFGSDVFREIMLLTVALTYFILFLLV